MANSSLFLIFNLNFTDTDQTLATSAPEKENRDYLHQEYKIKHEQDEKIIEENVNADFDANEGLASNSEDDEDWESQREGRQHNR